MKKTLMVIGLLSLMCSLAGCVKVPESIETVKPNIPVTDPAQVPEPDPGEDDIIILDGPGSYYINPVYDQLCITFKNEDAEGLCEWFTFYHMNDALYMEYMSDANAYWAGEFTPDDPSELEEQPEHGFTVKGKTLRFSSFSNFGKYWDEPGITEITLSDFFNFPDTVLTVAIDGEKVFEGETDLSRFGIHSDHDTLKEYINSDGIYNSESIPEYAGNGMYFSDVTDKNGKPVHLEFAFYGDGYAQLYSKTEGEPVEIYVGAYGVNTESENSIYVLSERVGHAGMPFEIMLYIETDDNGTLSVNSAEDSDTDFLHDIDRPVIFR